VEHDADQGFEAEAGDLQTLWSLAAEALVGVMTEVQTVDLEEERTIELWAPDLAAALVGSLGELLFLFETEGLLLRSIDKLELGERPPSEPAQGEASVQLRFRARGATYRSGEHPAKTGVKAVTHHGASVERLANGRWRAKILLDL
jgi:SHS2 domain-containing protein